MKFMIQMCLIGIALTCVAGAQQVAKPALQQGVSVEMPTAAHAVEMRAADDPSATVVTITADGKLFVGVQPVDVAYLSSLPGPVYVKADARVPYQNVLSVLDSLQAGPVVLLTAPTNSKSSDIVPPFGLKLTVASEEK